MQKTVRLTKEHQTQQQLPVQLQHFAVDHLKVVRGKDERGFQVRGCEEFTKPEHVDATVK
jgi:hypothetical protein